MSASVRPGITARNARNYRDRAARAQTEQLRDEYTHYAEVLENTLASERRCKRCGRSLEDPESVKAGYGQDCLQEIRAIEGTPAMSEGATP